MKRAFVGKIVLEILNDNFFSSISSSLYCILFPKLTASHLQVISGFHVNHLKTLKQILSKYPHNKKVDNSSRKRKPKVLHAPLAREI